MSNLNGGLSGCKIELISDDILRKYSSSYEYNKRLLSQIKKQSLFSHFVLKDIQAPIVFNISKEDLYYFDMQYISGYSYDEYFLHANIDEIEYVFKSLCSYIDFLIDNSRYYHEDVSHKIFYEKLLSMKDSDFLYYLINVVADHDLKIPHSFCHGDLTFANIIFHSNRLYFIDFLDSFLDSYLIDLAKLKQDLYHKWNLKIYDVKNLRMYQTYHYLWCKIENRYKDHLDTIAFKVLDAMNLLRIEPYLTNKKHRIILKTLIESTELYEKFNHSNGWEVF